MEAATEMVVAGTAAVTQVQQGWIVEEEEAPGVAEVSGVAEAVEGAGREGTRRG